MGLRADYSCYAGCLWLLLRVLDGLPGHVLHLSIAYWMKEAGSSLSRQAMGRA